MLGAFSSAQRQPHEHNDETSVSVGVSVGDIVNIIPVSLHLHVLPHPASHSLQGELAVVSCWGKSKEGCWDESR